METKKLAGGILSVSVKACITVLTIVLLYLAGRKHLISELQFLMKKVWMLKVRVMM